MVGPDITGSPRLADVYDIVTTTVYVPKDTMALTLDGTPNWPDVRQLTKLGTLRCGLAPKDVAAVLNRVAAALSDVIIELQRYACHEAVILAGIGELCVLSKRR